MINATQIRVGYIIKFNGDLCRVLKVQHVTPGKGNAVVQTDLRNLRTGIKINNRFRSTETVEQVEVAIRKMQHLYQEGKIFHFMDTETYEQLEIPEEVLADAIPFLKPEAVLSVSLYEGKPVGIALPTRVTLKITRCDPPSKGIAGATKDALLENGLTVRVPLFIKEGDPIVVDTESLDYLEKA
jgi:elongation factor P